MNHKISFEPPVPTGPEKNLIAAVDEQAWRPALAVLGRFDSVSFERITACPRVACAFQRFLAEAPDELVEGLRLQIAPTGCCRPTIGAWRRAVLQTISRAHLEHARAFGEQGNLAGAHGHTAWALAVLPRSEEHEWSLAGGLAQYVRFAGHGEEPVVRSYPSFESTPQAVAPHPDAIAERAGNGYHPYGFAELLNRGLEAACSDSFLLSALQIAFEEAHWPTWRGVLELGEEYPNRLKPAAEQLLRDNLPMSEGATEHLRALLAGLRPIAEPPRLQDYGSEDVSF